MLPRAACRNATAAIFRKHLPRFKRIIEPKSTLCPCGGSEMARIGEDVSERLDVVPAQLRVL